MPYSRWVRTYLAGLSPPLGMSIVTGRCLSLPPRRWFRLAPFRGSDALLKGIHEVDHVRLFGRRRRDQLLPFNLGLDQLRKLLDVMVFVVGEREFGLLER